MGDLLAAHEKVVDARLETLNERIAGLQWKWAAALAGGQVVAGLVAAFITRQPQVVQGTIDALASLPLV